MRVVQVVQVNTSKIQVFVQVFCPMMFVWAKKAAEAILADVSAVFLNPKIRNYHPIHD